MKAKMSKKSTLTITIMACLLAVAVATTIVLAAFTANKQATTTVTFVSGVQIQVDGAYKSADTAGDDDPISRADATLTWGCTVTGSQLDKTGTVTGAANDVTFEAITFINGSSSQSTTAWLIAKATITCTSPASPSQAQTNAAHITFNTTDWVAIGSTGWYAYGATAAGTPEVTLSSVGLDMTDLATSGSIAFVTAASIDCNDDVAGATYQAQVKVFAVNAGATDAQTQLATIISGS